MPYEEWLVLLNQENMAKVFRLVVSTTTSILPDLQRDQCQNLVKHQQSYLLEIQIWSGDRILQTHHV